MDTAACACISLRLHVRMLATYIGTLYIHIYIYIYTHHVYYTPYIYIYITYDKSAVYSIYIHIHTHALYEAAVCWKWCGGSGAFTSAATFRSPCATARLQPSTGRHRPGSKHFSVNMVITGRIIYIYIYYIYIYICIYIYIYRERIWFIKMIKCKYRCIYTYTVLIILFKDM